jgi:hypothetical protein
MPIPVMSLLLKIALSGISNLASLIAYHCFASSFAKS